MIRKDNIYLPEKKKEELLIFAIYKKHVILRTQMIYGNDSVKAIKW